MSEIGQINGNAALVQMAARYEALVRDFGLLRQLEGLEGEYLTAHDACTRLAALMPAEGIAEHCSIMLLDAEGSYLELRAVGTRYSTQGFAISSDVWHGKRFALGEGVAGQVAATGVHVRIQDTNADPNFLRLPESAVQVRSLMCFPLIDGGITLGVLNLSHGEPGFFDLDRERALLIVARRMARILGRALAPTAPTATGAILAVIDGAGDTLRISGPSEAVTGAPADWWSETESAWRDCVADDDRADWTAHRAPRDHSAASASLEYGFTGPDGLYRRLRETVLPAGEGHRCALVELVGGGAETARTNLDQSAPRLLHAQRIHTLGQLAGGVVHELGALLQGISNNLDLALIAPAQQETVELVSRARAASLRGADIVGKVLAFGRASNAESEPAPAAPGALLEEAAAMLRCVFDPGIVLHVECPSGLWRICADAGQLHQVLISLGVNARDALEQGDGRLLGGGERRVVLGAENVHYNHETPGPQGTPLEGDFVRFYVSDNGVGMSPDVQLRAFEPFFTTKAPGRATGLGLSTVYRVVRHHRGWVNLQSTPHRGTTVEFFFPALLGAIEADRGTEIAAIEESGPVCVLLVDDEALVRNLGAAILKRLGYHALTARDGRDALETYQANRSRIALIILDLQMPDMGGEAVLAQVRSIDPSLPIIYSSGMSYYEASDLPPERRPTALLKKPYLIATMSEIVQQALAGRPDGG